VNGGGGAYGTFPPPTCGKKKYRMVAEGKKKVRKNTNRGRGLRGPVEETVWGAMRGQKANRGVFAYTLKKKGNELHRTQVEGGT